LAQSPAELTSYLDAAGGLLEEAIVIRNGRFGLPDGPGMGVTVDARQLAKYRLDQ
jgi:L-alanine-DL-glutamate epimerase-like enolase superfamily enzyme